MSSTELQAASGAGAAPVSADGGAQAARPSSAAAGPAQLDLRDIHLPADPAAWPPAPGWWLLTLVLLAAAALAARAGWRQWRRLRRRQRILNELDRIGAREAGPAQIAAVAALLKRAALLRHSAREVAVLTGEPWLEFLDRTGGDGRFRDGPGRVLAEGPYAPGARGLEQQALLDLARDWLRRNL